MAVLAQAEEQEVEPLGQEPGILGGGRVQVLALRLHPVHGVRRNRQLVQQRLADHAIVALGMIGRNRPFVGEVHDDTIPGKIRALCEDAIHRPRGVTAGQGEAQQLARLRQVRDFARDPVSGERGEVIGAEDEEFHGYYRRDAGVT
jgi:hypothetical protein